MPSFIVRYCNREGDWKTVTCGEADHNCPPDYENAPCEWESREQAFEFAEKFQRDNDDVDKVLVLAQKR